jgi:hypothetical protein
VPEFKADAKAVSEALGELEPKARRSLTWAMRTHHERWSEPFKRLALTLKEHSVASCAACSTDAATPTSKR